MEWMHTMQMDVDRLNRPSGENRKEKKSTMSMFLKMWSGCTLCKWILTVTLTHSMTASLLWNGGVFCLCAGKGAVKVQGLLPSGRGDRERRGWRRRIPRPVTNVQTSASYITSFSRLDHSPGTRVQVVWPRQETQVHTDSASFLLTLYAAGEEKVLCRKPGLELGTLEAIWGTNCDRAVCVCMNGHLVLELVFTLLWTLCRGGGFIRF